MMINYDNSIYDIIPDDINISYRSLSKMLIDNSYDIAKTIHHLSVSTHPHNNSTPKLELGDQTNNSNSALNIIESNTNVI